MKDQNERSVFVNSLSRIWHGINLVRLIILNIVFFVILFFVLSWLMQDSGPKVPRSTILVIAPKGAVVDQLKPKDLKHSIYKMMGFDNPETLQKDLLDAIEAATDDERVKGILLDLNGFGYAGLTKLQDLGDALEKFRKSGKKVIAAADSYSRNSYYLAAHADEIYLHKMGLVLLDGYSRYRRYYKEALDKLEVDVHVFKVGKYKSAVEPYIRNDMSDAAKEANKRWMGVLWDSYLKDVAAARKLKVEDLKDYTDRLNEHLNAAGGEMGTAAKKAGLVDFLSTRDQVRKRLIELTGENMVNRSYYRIGYKSYLVARKDDRWGDRARGDVIGVVVAKGNILDGHQPTGTIGGDSTAKLLRKARINKYVKAIVLQVDSGGGSAFASEVIRREMELAREAGKPVVVSMSSVAASGGYWISMAANEVWAYPTTITGSIGIFGMIPTYQKTLAKYLGVHVDGLGTNHLAGAFRTDRALDPQVGAAIQAVIEQGYKQFLEIVSKARNSTPEKINEIAQGRVWIGLDAHKLGLVDKLGTLSQAMDSAAKLAKLGEGYKVKYFRKHISSKEQFLASFFAKFSKTKTLEEPQFPAVSVGQKWNPYSNTIKIMIEQMIRLIQFNDPSGVYAYWMEDVNF
jgi:protease IV